MIEPPQEIFSFQRKPVVLETAVKGSHLVGHVIDGNTLAEEVGGEDHTPVFEPNLCVLELVTVGLFLPVLVAPGEVARETGRQFLVVFEVTKTLRQIRPWWASRPARWTQC